VLHQVGVSFDLYYDARKHKIKIYRNIILYGCETWSLTLREEHRLRVFLEQGVEENIWA
jgi:hypothetical protein